MTSVDVGCTIVGGGIVGGAVAASLAGRLPDGVVLLERAPRLGTGVTSRNSGVSHGGMYYPTGSLKALTCVRGRRLLREFCRARDLPYHETGKLIVAVEESEREALERLYAQGLDNGVEDLRLLEPDELRRLEPEVAARAALWSPRTAIVDGEAVARAYGAQAAGGGVQVLTEAAVEGLRREGGGWRVDVRRGGQSWSHRSRWVVNAAGLHADAVAALAGVDVAGEGLVLRWAKGSYFAIDPRHGGRVARLIYPVPPADGSHLGVHLCLDFGGRMRLGPDVQDAAGGEDYTVDPARAGAFLDGARRFLPFLAPGDLTPDMAGLRPRLARHGAGFTDFVVRREEGALAGLINLVGIESPGLTAAPALAEMVAGTIAEAGG